MDKIKFPHSERKEKPEIIRYHDYREYLKDWFAFCKASQSSLSLRTVAAKAGMSVSNLSMILSGSRKLSSKILIRLAPALKLKKSELGYLEILMLLGNATTQEERVDAFERLNQFRVYRSQNQNESSVFRYLTHWYFVAIREMSAMAEFKADPKWIQSRLQYPVPLKEIESALEFLITNKFIEKLPDGTIRPPSRSLDCLGGVYRMALTQFHKEMLGLAGKSIENTSEKKRKILGYTLTVNVEQFEKIQNLLNQVYDEIRKISQEQSSNAESVYQIELALFPLTKG